MRHKRYIGLKRSTKYPEMFYVKLGDGTWSEDFYNLSRAKDALVAVEEDRILQITLKTPNAPESL